MHDTDNNVAVKAGYLAGGARPFLVGVDEDLGAAHITVHASTRSMTRREARDLRRELEQEGVFSRCRVRRHGTFGLEGAESLETFLTPFNHDQILYDPTGAFDRARDIVSFAHAVRHRLGRNVQTLLWQGREGTIYVVLDQQRLFKSRKARRSDLVAIERFLRKTLGETCGHAAKNAVKSVRISFTAPDVQATPIDRQSVRRRENPVATLASGAIATAVFVALVGLGVFGMASAGKLTDTVSKDAGVARGNG